MKVVDLVARIPKQLHLHFSDFSTNFYEFPKFAVFELMAFLHLAPWTLASSQGKSLAAKQRSKGGAISGVQGLRR